jgi:pimeloyl-ACP methyl ester carboxylesterase
MPEITLPQGTIRYRDSGPRDAETLVFVHGLLVDGSLWDGVVARLGEDVRCVVPDLPLGSHRTPMAADADLTPRGVAALIAAFLAALDLRDVTLVANDTGGAIAQLVATEHPERLGRLVLTPCDAYDNFLPPGFRPLQTMARIPGMVWLVLQGLRIPAARRLPMAYGMVAKHPPEQALLARWLAPATHSAGVRRDVAKLLRGIDAADTIAAAARLADFDRPALVLWPPEERTFPFAHAERLAATLPQGRLERLTDSWAFAPLDQPGQVADALARFLEQTSVAEGTMRAR